VYNLLGIGYDNASVNTGAHHGPSGLFKSKVLSLFNVDNTSHLLALCASAASKTLPEWLESFMHDTIHYITHSPKRIGEFGHHYRFAEIQAKQLLSVVSTRWLSFEASIRLPLEAWNALLFSHLRQGHCRQRKQGEGNQNIQGFE
jgi:hypothetical protein